MSYSNSRTMTPVSELEHGEKSSSPTGSVLHHGGAGSSKKAAQHEDNSNALRPTETNVSVYPDKKRLIPLMLSLYMTVFLVALDRTIIATAIPRITDDFHSLGDVGWYGSSYLLTACSFQLLYGKIYTFYNPKNVFLTAIFMFEVGSAICGAAPTSTAFIVGRAIAGLGSSGIFSGAVVIMIGAVPLDKRPMYQGFIGAVFAVASVIGPLLGGVFTEKVSWRWCFYINLPVGGVAVAVLLIVLHLPPNKEAPPPLKEQIKKLDPVGTFFFMPGVICLLLALQWGGSTYAWSSPKIIALLVLFGVLIIAFAVVQVFNGDNSTIPVRILTQRSVAFGFVFVFFAAGAMMTIVYYVPIWFQAVKGVSAVNSGIRTLPFVLGLVIASIITGALVTRIGYYTPFMYLSTILLSVGAGLISTFSTNTPKSHWIGYQALMGLGMGFGMQQPSVAAQTVLKHKDVPTGVSMMFFAQSFGGAVFISVAQNLFAQNLVKGLIGRDDLDPAMVVGTGATELRKIFNQQQLGKILVIYNAALTKAFYVAVACACLTIIGSLGMEWKNIKQVKAQRDKERADRAAEKAAEASGEEQA